MLVFITRLFIVLSITVVLMILSFLGTIFYIKYKRREEKRYAFSSDPPPGNSRRDYHLPVTQPVRQNTDQSN